MFRFKTFLFAVLLCVNSGVFAQGGFKKIPMLEHFTNTWCSTCANRNPALFTYLNGFAGQYHHMTIHPNIPYQGCIYYQANVAENTARKTYYGVSSTPQVYLNGTYVSSGSALLPNALFTQSLATTSPIGVTVAETTGNTRTATVQVLQSGNLSAGNYVLHAAIVERETNYTSPNGETKHRNVFRRFLTPTNGYALSSYPAEFTSNYTIDAAWNAAEIYVIAYVQNTTTKEVMNSGSKFQGGLVDVNTPELDVKLSVAPNPTTDLITIASPDQNIELVEVYDMRGGLTAQYLNVKQLNFQFETKGWKQGIYLVQVKTAKGVKTVKIAITD
jgi:hypothetical protein